MSEEVEQVEMFSLQPFLSDNPRDRTIFSQAVHATAHLLEREALVDFTDTGRAVIKIKVRKPEKD